MFHQREGHGRHLLTAGTANTRSSMLRTAPPLNRGARQNAAGAAGCVLRQQQYGRSELADEVAHSAVDVGLGLLGGAGGGALHIRVLNKK